MVAIDSHQSQRLLRSVFQDYSSSHVASMVYELAHCIDDCRTKRVSSRSYAIIKCHACDKCVFELRSYTVTRSTEYYYVYWFSVIGHFEIRQGPPHGHYTKKMEQYSVFRATEYARYYDLEYMPLRSVKATAVRIGIRKFRITME